MVAAIRHIYMTSGADGREGLKAYNFAFSATLFWNVVHYCICPAATTVESAIRSCVEAIPKSIRDMVISASSSSSADSSNKMTYDVLSHRKRELSEAAKASRESERRYNSTA